MSELQKLLIESIVAKPYTRGINAFEKIDAELRILGAKHPEIKGDIKKLRDFVFKEASYFVNGGNQ